ncbi:MAG TPA: hypothetical protein VJ306_00210 [Pyrinomonadaceae bacterium]|nr:hypothetical protein [Pyrinomonadaceae bacterium]
MNLSPAIDFESMETFVNRVKVKLNLTNDVVYYNLITIYFTHMVTQFSLTFF